MDSHVDPNSVEPAQELPLSSRRHLLNWLWAGFGLLAFIELGWLTKSILGSRKKRESRRLQATLIEAGTVEQFNPGSVSPIPAGKLYLSRLEDGSFIALSRSCTHLGCAVPWDETEQKFICPCHGSTFDIRGSVLTPPATRPLEYYPVRIENGLVKIEMFSPLRREKFEPSQAVQG